MSSNATDTKNRILQASYELMEQNQGLNVSMSNIAKAAKVSRQAVYLHFASRAELMIATTQYVDRLKGLRGRLERIQETENGIDNIQACVEVWGNYIPEIYGVAKAMLMTRDTDEAMAAAWENCMGSVRSFCKEAIIALNNDDQLNTDWSLETAIDLFWTMMSVQNWEQLTLERGWSNEKYIANMHILVAHTFIK